MEIRRLEKTIFYDGIAFLRYRLEYPAAAEGEFPDFAEAMTKSYRDYIEGEYLHSLCALYDADTTRRKRFRHEIVQVVQRAFFREEGKFVSVAFNVIENNFHFQFGWTFDREQGIVMALRDFGLKPKGMKRMNLFYREGGRYTVFRRDGTVLKKLDEKEKKDKNFKEESSKSEKNPSGKRG